LVGLLHAILQIRFELVHWQKLNSFYDKLAQARLSNLIDSMKLYSIQNALPTKISNNNAMLTIVGSGDVTPHGAGLAGAPTSADPASRTGLTAAGVKVKSDFS